MISQKQLVMKVGKCMEKMMSESPSHLGVGNLHRLYKLRVGKDVFASDQLVKSSRVTRFHELEMPHDDSKYAILYGFIAELDEELLPDEIVLDTSDL